MPLRATPFLLLAAAIAAAASAGCASADAPAAAPSADGVSAGAGSLEIPAAAGPGIRAGWRNLKRAEKRGQIMDLVLLAESSEEGRKIARGYSMEGGKVVSDEDAAGIVAAFERAGFDRFAVKAGPGDGPPGALGVVWLDRGQGIESLFLVPGARQSPGTEDLPDVYQGLKVLLLGIHQSTPGSSVRVGKGWSGEDLLRQKPGETVR